MLSLGRLLPSAVRERHHIAGVQLPQPRRVSAPAGHSRQNRPGAKTGAAAPTEALRAAKQRTVSGTRLVVKISPMEPVGRVSATLEQVPVPTQSGPPKS